MFIRPSRLSLDNGKQPFDFPDPRLFFLRLLVFCAYVHPVIAPFPKRRQMASFPFPLHRLLLLYSYAPPGIYISSWRC